MSHLADAAVLSIATGAAAFIISMSKISKRPRVWLAGQTWRGSGWLSELVACPFCVSVWLSLAAAAIYRPLLVQLFWPLDYLVTALTMAGAAMVPLLIIKKALFS